MDDTGCRYVAAFDPGKLTGWALYDRETEEFDSGQTNFDETCNLVFALGQKHLATLLVVSESFIITQATAKNSQAPWSLELIGVMRYASRMYTRRDLVTQAPATAKRFSSDERLKQMGWHRPGKGHANDAARHLLVTLATRGWLDRATLTMLTTYTQSV